MGTATRIQLAEKPTKGLGAGANPKIGTEQGLLEFRDCIDTVIEIRNDRLLHTADRP
ncbi:MAG: hypothetical protein HYX75_18530 [Acidobacteria bacterium]|nr:hypothetical protein [Acidobacteriota bacterium]